MERLVGVQREAVEVRVDLVHLRNFSMGSNLNPAHKVLDQMAARELIWNFAKIFGGVHLNKVWHTMVVVVCKIE